MQPQQHTHFKAVENMEPMEMMAEIVQLRNITARMIYLVQENHVLRGLLLANNIVPMWFPDLSPDGDNE